MTIKPGNIPFEANEEQMQSICELVGRVVEFRLVMDNKRGRHKVRVLCMSILFLFRITKCTS